MFASAALRLRPTRKWDQLWIYVAPLLDPKQGLSQLFAGLIAHHWEAMEGLNPFLCSASPNCPWTRKDLALGAQGGKQPVLHPAAGAVGGPRGCGCRQF